MRQSDLYSQPDFQGLLFLPSLIPKKSPSQIHNIVTPQDKDSSNTIE